MPITEGISFKVGVVDQKRYRIGDKLSWQGKTRPDVRPTDGNLKTIGYFECSNLKCSTWHDCFPEVQEVLITIEADVIVKIEPITYKPNEFDFDILEPKNTR